MRILLAIIALLFALDANAATKYVATTGSDSNDGSEGSPWASLHHAHTNIAPGDTVLVSAGVYTGADLALTNRGTVANPILYRGTGATNMFGFGTYNTAATIQGSNITISGFTILTNGINIGSNASYITITNCYLMTNGLCFESPMTVAGVGFGPETTSKRCTVINNTFDKISGLVYSKTMIVLNGVGHVIQGNVFRDGLSCDVFRYQGSNHLICANVMTNIGEVEGYSNHPDIGQIVRNDEGYYAVDILFERNYLVNNPCQIGQLNQSVVVTNDALWGITFRNNVFKNMILQTSISCPNIKFYNNTFYGCTNAGIGYTWYFPSHISYATGLLDDRGHAYGGVVMNNAFINTPYAYSHSLHGINFGAMTGDGGTGYAQADVASSVLYVTGSYTSIVGTISVGELYITNDSTVIYTWPASWFTNTFRCVSNMVDGAGGLTIAQQQTYINSSLTGFRIKTDSYPGGAMSAVMVTRTEPDPTFDLVTDYNFHTNAELGEVHQITSGDVNLVSTSLLKPMLGSVLIDAGTNMDSLVTNDFELNGRPSGSEMDVGAYEFDPTLLAHLNFSETNASGVADITGHAVHGVMFNTTNSISYTNGIVGAAAVFTTNAIMNDATTNGQSYPGYPAGYPDYLTNTVHWYEASQYLGVTNIAPIQYLTNGTISFWGQFNAKTLQYSTHLFDGAYSPVSDPGNMTNCWRIRHVGNERNVQFRAYDIDSGSDGDLLIGFPDMGDAETGATTNLDMYVVTFSCTNSTAVAYTNGVAASTNTFSGFPWLRVYNYLCVGASQHKGTPLWGDDKYPNDCYHYGQLDDIRIYNRTLTGAEVLSLYLGSGLAQLSGGGEESNPALSISPTTLTITTLSNATDLVTNYLVWNSGDTGELLYTNTESSAWMVLDPLTGSSTGEQDEITMTLDRETVGTNQADVTVSWSNAVSQTLSVTLRVTNGVPAGGSTNLQKVTLRGAKVTLRGGVTIR